MTVYLDVLLGVNWLVNFFLLRSVAAIHRIPRTTLRILLGAAVLSFASLSVLLPDFGVALSLGYRLLTAAVGVWVTFGNRPLRVLLRLTATLFLACFAYGGVMGAILVIFRPSGVAVCNGGVYVNLSPLLLITLTLIAYAAVWLLRGRLRPKGRGCPYLTLHLQKGNRTVTVTAKIDTGFTLNDPYSPYPLVLLSPSAARRLGVDFDAYRLIPCRTVQGEGLLSSGMLGSVTATVGPHTATFLQVVGAVAKENFDGPFDALVGTDFLERMEWDEKETTTAVAVAAANNGKGTGGLHRRRHTLASTLDLRKRETVDRPIGRGR